MAARSWQDFFGGEHYDIIVRLLAPAWPGFRDLCRLTQASVACAAVQHVWGDTIVHRGIALRVWCTSYERWAIEDVDDSASSDSYWDQV